jgi:ATP-dependent DNA helicase RecG
MALQTSRITSQQANKILEIREGQFVDLKAKEIAPNKLSKHLSAFANAEGGELFIGIAEDRVTKTRTWDGFPDEEAANGHIQALETVFPGARICLYLPSGRGFSWTCPESGNS